MMLSVPRLQLKKVKQKCINLNPEAGLLVDNDELPFGQGGHRQNRGRFLAPSTTAGRIST